MKSQQDHKPDDKKQSAAFVEKARELDADGDDSKADVLMGRLATMKPEPRPTAKPRAKENPAS